MIIFSIGLFVLIFLAAMFGFKYNNKVSWGSSIGLAFVLAFFISLSVGALLNAAMKAEFAQE